MQIQRVFYLHELPQVDFGDVHPARQINAVIVEFIQRNRHAVGLHVGLGLQHGGQIGGQLLDFFARGVVGQTNRKLPQAALAAVIVLDVLRGNLGIFYRDSDIIRAADAGGAEGDVLNGALTVAQHDVIPDAEGPLEHQRDARDQAVQRGLRGQRDRQSGDTRAGQQAGDRHAEAVQHGDARKQADQRVKDVLKKAPHRLICLQIQMVLCAAQQKPGDRGRAPAAERDIEDDQQVGGQIQVLQKYGVAHQLKRQRLDGSRAQQHPEKARHRREKAVQQNTKPRCHVTFCTAQKAPGDELVHLGCTGSRQRQQRRGQKREKIVGEFFHGGYLGLLLCKAVGAGHARPAGVPLAGTGG